MKASRFLLLLALCFVASFPVQSQTKQITAAEAKDHVGETATVCGQVASTRYADRSKGQPTFMNLDKPYPNAVFTIVIWGADRAKFGAPESKYRDANVCVAGKISSYRGTPEIVAREPSQIVVQK
jgi:hypothetical protein